MCLVNHATQPFVGFRPFLRLRYPFCVVPQLPAHVSEWLHREGETILDLWDKGSRGVEPTILTSPLLRYVGREHKIDPG